ncbi:MAG: hypothetical protein A2X68_11425 [Ignavibacteria bacterium GWC2_56_12]|nr:MAG: hypothetical protein A2X68_11425 [Ignavibacteria bacterium GWC2_56_12]
MWRLEAQTSERLWIVFRDKGAVSIAGADPRSLGISDRALQRRAKVLPADRLLTDIDLPVSESYIHDVTLLGVRVRSVSRWLNAVSADVPAASLASIRSLPFVREVRPVMTMRRKPEPMISTPAFRSLDGTSGAAVSYGFSLTQIRSLNVLPLHDLGVIGQGVLVGMLDDGYNNYRVHAALKNIRVVAAYDFIQRDSSVSIGPGDSVEQGYHGAATLSTLAGYHNGSLIGTAYGASVALGKTEVVPTETRFEEDLYVEGLEWLEGLGVDIISTSLGYIDWYSYDSLDGMTATTTKAARTLASRGVLLVTAMGNEGNFRAPGLTGTLIAPADADSIISVGATLSDGPLTSYSSTGPTFDGRMKPEVVAQGTGVYAANGATVASYYFGSGTSFATPLTAGAAALILSAHPEATPMQIRAALMNTTTRYYDGTWKTAMYPNPFYGWGMVNAYAAALSLGPVMSNTPLVGYFVIQGDTTLYVSIRMASATPLASGQPQLFYRRRTDSVFTSVQLAPQSSPQLYAASIPVMGEADTSFEGYVTIAAESGPVLRRPTGTALFALSPSSDSVLSLFPPPALPKGPSAYVLDANYPNPFNAGTNFIFHAPAPEYVELAVFNVLGERVRTLFSGKCRLGDNLVTWSDARDDAGQSLPSGVYFSRLSTPRGIKAGRLLLLK